MFKRIKKEYCGSLQMSALRCSHYYENHKVCEITMTSFKTAQKNADGRRKNLKKRLPLKTQGTATSIRIHFSFQSILFLFYVVVISSIIIIITIIFIVTLCYYKSTIPDPLRSIPDSTLPGNRRYHGGRQVSSRYPDVCTLVSRSFIVR